jgi:putative ABC transport system permease protein
MLLDLSLRSLWRNKVRSGLTILGIVLAIAAIVALGSFSEGINGLVEEQLKFASGFISVEEGGGNEMQQGPPGMNSKVPLEYLEEIKEMGGVREAVPGLFALEPKSQLFVVGVSLQDMEYFELQNIEFDEGGWPGDGEQRIVLGYQTAESTGLQVGDTLKILDDDYEVSGVLEEMKNIMDLGAITSFESARKTFDFGDYASTFMVEPEDLEDIDQIAREIENTYDDLEAETPGERSETASETSATVSIFTFGIGIVASIVASIGIINTMVMIVMERKREFGIMKALGAEKLTILSIVIFEAGMLGVIGGLVGVGIGVLGSGILNSAYPFPLASISIRLIVLSLIYSVVLAVLAAAYPAYQAIKVNPVEAMREK